MITIEDVPTLVEEYRADPNCRPLLWIECETKDPLIIEAFLLLLSKPAQ